MAALDFTSLVEVLAFDGFVPVGPKREAATQTFAPQESHAAKPHAANHARPSGGNRQVSDARADVGSALGDFSTVPLRSPPAAACGFGPGGGGSDPLPATGPETAEAPAPDNPLDTAPPALGPAETAPPQTDPAGEAVPMAQVAVSSIKANIGPNGTSIAHVPPCGNQPTIRFTAGPASAKPVTWKIDSGTAASGTVLTPAADTLTATLSLGAGQKGGVLDIKADNNEGGQMMPYRLASHPTAIASTSAIGDPTKTSLFGGVFDHVFKSNDGQTASLDQVGMGEKFPNLPTPDAATHTFETPFGEFTLQTGTLPNTPAKGNWLLTSSGELGDDHDTVGIQKKMIDIGRHLKSDSNPTPANPIPVGFTVDQEFYWWCPHSAAGSRWTLAAKTTHERTLRMKKGGGAEFIAKVNGKENVMAYDDTDANVVKTGVTNAKAAPGSVAPSPAGSANTVQITADLFPSGRDVHFSITGAKLGCKIDAKTGTLTIGSSEGSVKVRVANVKDGPNWDEVDVTIATPAAPKAPANPPSKPNSSVDIPPSDL